jgi:23S rRNA (pseudouridine1915-N3)-methyltransferase
VTLLLAAVGRCRGGPEALLFEHYRQRLSWPLQLREVEERRKLPALQRLRREADHLRAALPKGGVLVALDERGVSLDSAGLAHRLGAWRDSGRQDIAFVIGGADGLDPELRQSADLQLSLGVMTWPHLLVRALLAEQLYRAETILAGHPYHRRSL